MGCSLQLAVYFKKLILFFLVIMFSLVIMPIAHAHTLQGEVEPVLKELNLLNRLVYKKEWQNIDLMLSSKTKERLAIWDKMFNLKIKDELENGILQKNHVILQKSFKKAGVAGFLENTTNLLELKDKISRKDRTKVFWRGRNYFILLVEAELLNTDPILAQTFDRELDEMLYCIEDGKWERCENLLKEFISKADQLFNTSFYLFYRNASSGRAKLQKSTRI